MADTDELEPSREPPGAERFRTVRKPSYPIGPPLREYLTTVQRECPLPVSYERLHGFQETIPLIQDGRDTLWETAIYHGDEMFSLKEDLKRVYALLKVDGDMSVMRHLYVDRVDFCAFGNSLPFRIRIVNAINDNPDYFYVKQADASRIYGLELEHLLSPNRLNFVTHEATLVEEHIAGLPGDRYIETWLHSPEIRPVRVAKELVKFNERCFVRLLGDMRSYNFVVVLTPDFEGWQVRFRAMDFDQQSFSGRRTFYLPQFFKENLPLVQFCTSQLNVKTAYQYQREERSLVLHRCDVTASRLTRLLDAMAGDRIAPDENVVALRDSLAAHFDWSAFLRCESMGALVRENLRFMRIDDERARQGVRSPGAPID